MSEYRMRYDPRVDALYIRVREGRVVESEEISEGVIVDYDESGNVVGIEVLEFSKRDLDLNEFVVKGPGILVRS